MTRADTMTNKYDELEEKIHMLELQIELNEMLGELGNARYLAQLRTQLQRMKKALAE